MMTNNNALITTENGFIAKAMPENINEDKFWRNVDQSEDCWLWTAGKNPNGYGGFSVAGTTYGAHRISYYLATGRDPIGKVVLHSCDNPACVRPDHLSLGTQKDNMADAARKNKLNRINANRALDYSQAQTIRLLAACGVKRQDLEFAFGVAKSTIANIITGKTYQEA